MKKILLSVAAMSAAAGILTAANTDSDPVLMTVDGRDVKVSEFEYLYNKNNSQQLKPQSVKDYLDMFVDYKLKVADAENAGIDTTAAFLAEYGKFRDELAAPYLRDKEVEDALLREAYDHLGRDVKVSHIMLPVNRNRERDNGAYARMDSIRDAIVKGQMTFEEAAEKYSIDTPTAQRGGLMGWISAGRFPWPFEKAAYDTSKGNISPVIDSGFGLHIVKVDDVREARGEVQASHILKLTRDVPPEAIPAQKAAIDSIYQLLLDGADFADMARRESQDPGSAARGGDLGWFGSGMMVAEFDSVAFALKDGELSKPFETAFGYHIIKRGDHRGIESFENAREQLLAMMGRDGRIDEPRKARMKQLAEKYDAIFLKANMMALKHKLNIAPMDSVTYATLAADQTPLAKIGDENVVTVSEAFGGRRFSSGAQAAKAIEESAQDLLDKQIARRAIDELAVENTDYRNLINEYRDGILLFEISNQNVWDRAAKDKEGLEKFFKENAKKYAWSKPHFKGFIIFAASDSVLNEATKYADTLTEQDAEKFVGEMRKHFGKNIKIERVIASEGENPITDYLAFHGSKPENKNSRWASYCAYRGRVLDAPEEAVDVRGAAATDYQALLEQQWLKKLHKKYKVKINKNVLKTIKSN